MLGLSVGGIGRLLASAPESHALPALAWDFHDGSKPSMLRVVLACLAAKYPYALGAHALIALLMTCIPWQVYRISPRTRIGMYAWHATLALG